MSHASGPWIIGVETEGGGELWAKGGLHVATVYSHPSHKPALNNLALIAAAPDLLAALEMIGADKQGKGMWKEWAQQTARVAIAKAKGD